MKPKILLTGAAGFTGLYFKSAAEAAGYQLLVLQADLTNRAAVAGELMQLAPDRVVHLAAKSFVGYADEAAFYDVNVIGTMNLLAALAALPVKPAKVLLASSANIYGNCDVSPIKESQPAAPMNHYAMSKLAMEHMAWTYLDKLPILITRPFNYTGPGQAQQFLIPKLVSHFVRRAERIELGNLDVEREFNDVRMVCDAYLKLLDYGVPGQAYNVCSGLPYKLEYVIKTLEEITHYRTTIQINSSFVRHNEVQSLCGSPDKLIDTIGPLLQHDLADTLSLMLKG